VERELQVSKRMFDLDYVIFRPHNVYGERQNIGDKYRNVVGIFMNQILQDQPMSAFGDGTQTRAFSYISDVAPVIARAPETPAAYNQIFNVGADQPHSINDLATAVAEAMGVEPRITHLPAREEVVHAFSSHGKAASAFGTHKPCDLRTGLARMAEWVRKHGARQSSDFGEIEVEKNLPKVWRKGNSAAVPVARFNSSIGAERHA
jgi:UDP-glucose 4-epimerase